MFLKNYLECQEMFLFSIFFSQNKKMFGEVRKGLCLGKNVHNFKKCLRNLEIINHTIHKNCVLAQASIIFENLITQCKRI